MYCNFHIIECLLCCIHLIKAENFPHVIFYINIVVIITKLLEYEQGGARKQVWGKNTGQLPQVAFTQQLGPSHLVQVSCCHQRCRSGPPNPQRQVLRLRNEVLLQLGRMVTSLGLNTLGWCQQDPLPNMTSHLRLHLLKPACTIET